MTFYGFKIALAGSTLALQSLILPSSAKLRLTCCCSLFFVL